MEVPEHQRATARRHLLVFANGRDVTRWLTAGARAGLDVRRRVVNRAESLATEHGSLGADGPGLRSVRVDGVARLPVDGPVGVLRLALAEIRAHGHATPVVIPESLDGSPPSPIHLVEVLNAGLSPAVDLDQCGWTTERGMWVPGRSGPVFIDVDWSYPNDCVGVARLLAALLPLPPGSPVIEWLNRVVDQPWSAASEWTEPLQAAYLEVAVAEINRARGRVETRRG